MNQFNNTSAFPQQAAPSGQAGMQYENAPAGNVLVEARRLSKSYGSLHPALFDVNFSLEGGRIVGLLGPNGSGKTTLMKIMNGLLVPSAGEIRIGGFKPGVESKGMISYLPDASYLPRWMNVETLISFFADFFQDFRPDKAYAMLADLGISKKDRLKTLSKGNKEKVQLILAMSREAKVYCLDEPIGGVDPAARDYILTTIIRNYSENALVLISTHLISDVERILDQVLLINQGRLLAQRDVDDIRETEGKSVDDYFREVFRC